STDSYQKVSNLAYVLALTACAAPSLTANPLSPGATGASTTFTASSATCANPRYRFWVRPPGGTWTVQQAYGPANTFTWTSTGLARGRRQGSGRHRLLRKGQQPHLHRFLTVPAALSR